MKRRALLLKNSTKASDPAVVSHQGRDKVPLGTTGGLVPRLQADRSPTALEDVGRTPPWEPRVGARLPPSGRPWLILTDQRGAGVPVSDRRSPPTRQLQGGRWPSCLA